MFNLDKFNEENPVLDPFVERLQERGEVLEPLTCWACLGIFDRVTGERIGEADPEGEDVTSMREMCGRCIENLRIGATLVEYE